MEDSTIILLAAAAAAGGYYIYNKKKKEKEIATTQSATNNTKTNSMSNKSEDLVKESKEKAKQTTSATATQVLSEQNKQDITNITLSNLVGSNNNSIATTYDNLVKTYLDSLSENTCYTPAYIYVKTAKPWTGTGYEVYSKCFGKDINSIDDDNVKSNFVKFISNLVNQDGYNRIFAKVSDQEPDLTTKFQRACSIAEAHSDQNTTTYLSIYTEIFCIYTILTAENVSYTLSNDDFFYFFDLYYEDFKKQVAAPEQLKGLVKQALQDFISQD